jgi:hypothetical protein
VAGDLAGGRSVSIFPLRDLRLLPAVFEVILLLKQIKLLPNVHVNSGGKEPAFGMLDKIHQALKNLAISKIKLA